jgi:flavin reductase (DIM6/NTAB) family NADH-FMN oxidoreductase RutF
LARLQQWPLDVSRLYQYDGFGYVLARRPAEEGATVDNQQLPIDSESMRQAMRLWATGITIVSASHQGMRHGMTVSSFTSISLTPPLILVSLQNKARTYGLVVNSGFFGVMVLASGQQVLSDRFAGREDEDEDRFRDLETFSLVSGAPFLYDGLAYFDCRVKSAFDLGTHTIFIGEALALDAYPELNPLVYYNREYRYLTG